MHSPFLLDTLARRSLLVVTGKGGVGKTAVSATLGRAFAARGRRVLVVEVDPRENLHRMLGVPPSGGEIVAAGPRLWVQNLKPQQVLDEIVREQVPIPLLADRVLHSPVYEQFAAGAPGLKEMAILGHAYRLLRGREPGAPEIDLIVLDAPATGHGVALLSAPQLVADVIDRGPFGRMSRDLAVLIADPERCGVAVVTQAEEMPVEEALELAAALRDRLGRDPELLVVNGLYPPAPPASQGDGDDPLAALWRRRRAIHDRELGRLYARWPWPAGAAAGKGEISGESRQGGEGVGGGAGRARAGEAREGGEGEAGGEREGEGRPGRSGILELPLLPLDGGPALVAALGDCLEAGGLAAAGAASSGLEPPREQPQELGSPQGAPAWS